MFVPIELLKPIYDELVATGTSKRGKHPWLGITSQEMEGRVFVQKVQTDSPAERAGLKSGDIVFQPFVAMSVSSGEHRLPARRSRQPAANPWALRFPGYQTHR